MTLVKSNLIRIIELENRLIRSPVLDARARSSTALNLITAEEVLVVARVEVGTFTFVGVGGRVAEEIAHEVVPAVEEVAVGAGCGVYLVHESVFVVGLSLKLWQSLNVVRRVIKARSKDQSLIVVLLIIRKFN